MTIAWVEALVKGLSFDVYRIVPLLSLGMYLILAVFSDSRRREDKGWKRVVVWVAYQLTDWGPAYIIGNLYIETSPHDKMMIAFWVPFLLLHHARPDNISAYAIEDSKLWRRLILIDIPLSLGSIFIVCRYILTECSAGYLLRWASGIMLPLGILKYMESILALWRSELDHIRGSGLSNKKTFSLDDYRDLEKLTELDDEEALLVAHDLFEMCKGAFCDYDAKINHGDVISMFSGRWESMCKVVEMELSLMYDILYTKAAVVHTLHGYAIRVVSPLLTAIALLLFFLQCKKDMKPIDTIVSYILLGTTLFLDGRWLFRALASAWTHSYFKRMPHNWLKHALWCQGLWKKLRCCGVSLFLSRLSLWLWTCACPKDPKSYRRWAGPFGQCNLLSQCTAGYRHNLNSIPRLGTESEGHSSLRGFEWEDHSRGLEIPYYVKKLVFMNICTNLFPDPAGTTDHGLTSNTDSPGSPGPPDNGKPLTGLISPKEPIGNISPERPGLVKPPTGPTDPKHPEEGSTVVTPTLPGWLGCGCKLPNYCTCVHPGSVDPGGPCPGNQYGPPGTACPRERICNGIDDEPSLCPQYPRDWICNGVDGQSAPWLQYPRERICVGVNNILPRLPYPWQVHVDIRNAPFEANEYNVQARPHHYPDEQAAEYSLEPYEQQTDRWSYGRAPPESYEQVNLLKRVCTGSNYDEKAAGIKPMDNEDMGFPPELQEAILIWHIATDAFLVTRKGSEELDKAIKKMSDYMMFLVANRPKMLPGLTLHSLHEKTCDAVVEIGKVAKPTSYTRNKKDVVAEWMLENRDNLNDPIFCKDKGIIEGPGMTIVRAGIELAGKLLHRPSKSKITEESARMVKGLEHWIPRLQKLPMDAGGILEFILDAWVRLLMLASIRCSRDSHAKRLSCGGELTTLVWIITEHTKNSVVKENLKLLLR